MMNNPWKMSLLLILSIVKVIQRNSRVLILTGVHGGQDGKLGDFDEDFVNDCENQLRVLKKKKEKEIEEGEIQFKVEDVGQTNDRGIKELDEGRFVEAVCIRIDHKNGPHEI